MHTPGSVCGQWTAKVKKTKTNQKKKKKRRVKVSQILANHIFTDQITVPHQKKKTKDAHAREHVWTVDSQS